MKNQKLKETLANKELFIFDLDGTLVNLEDLNKNGYAATLKRFFNMELSNQDYQKFFSGTKTAEGFENFLKDMKISLYKVEELVVDFRSQKEDLLINRPSESMKLIESAFDYLESLRNSSKKIVLATSTILKFTHIILKHFEIDNLFDLIITAEDVARGKPAPDIYNLAVETMHFKKSDCVVFEDSLNGIRSAKAANILCVGILSEGYNEMSVSSADFVIKNYTELL